MKQKALRLADIKRRRFAEQIARDLFTNGSAERAQRLVLTIDTPHGRNLGGLSETAVIDRIEKWIRAHEAAASGLSPSAETQRKK